MRKKRQARKDEGRRTEDEEREEPGIMVPLGERVVELRSCVSAGGGPVNA
jgi:hypothetical protein